MEPKFRCLVNMTVREAKNYERNVLNTKMRNVQNAKMEHFLVIRASGYYRDNSTGLCQKCSLCYGRALGIDVKDEVVKECKQHKKSPLFRCMPVISFITTSTEESSLSETSQEDIFVDYENFFASSMKESQQPNLQLIFNIIIGLLSFILVFLISMLFLCKFTLSRRKKKERNICLNSSVTKSKHREKDMPFILHRYIQDIKESGAQSIQNCSEPGYHSSPFTYIDDGDTPYTDGDRIEKRRKEKMNEIHRNSQTFMFDSRKVDELNGNMSCDFHKNDVYCISM
ncbi:hypothetical protein FSP39_013554 [Pinctada imbricata]|uniref:Uncharacterized protein n=1 Tax=Pinctada imbricata TaxID=66713 RepID=A0AA88Y8B6_PINIB|nr:hypothetical protein FSP39_013554 [Pinctada imbricata]